MMRVGPLVVDEALAFRSAEILKTSAGYEELLAMLRHEGEGKMGCIRVLVKVGGLDLREAKRTVELSPVWQDHREADQAFRESAIRALEQIQAEESATDGELQKAS